MVWAMPSPSLLHWGGEVASSPVYFTGGYCCYLGSDPSVTERRGELAVCCPPYQLLLAP